jgi:WD40 repeat protein
MYSAAFSPDGKILVSGTWNGTIQFWDPITRNPISSPLPGHKGAVTSLAFSHDGKLLASGGEGGDIILWDITKRQRLGQPMIGHDLPVITLSFSVDDKTLISSSNYFSSDTVSPNANVVIWNLDPLSWIEISCQRAGRNFTRAEWERYFPNDEYRKTCEQWP